MRATSTSRPNIALLIDLVSNAYQRDLIDGVLRAAAERGANVWIFVGGRFQDEELRRGDNVVYQLASKPAIDGIVAAMSSLINQIGRAPGERLLRGFRLPVVSIGLTVTGVPSVGVDNRSGLTQLCEHLVEQHGYRKFAMIAGPAHNEESQERIAVCHDTLEKLGATLPEQRVTRQGFSVQSGVDGLRDLVEKRRALLDTLDAILCANDLIAEGALRGLLDRGVSVPERLALTGFDDQERAGFLNPPLTTVRQPVSDLAQSATRYLLQSVNGRSVPFTETVPSTLVLRRSCGCLPPETKLSGPAEQEEGTARGPTRAAGSLQQRREPLQAALSSAARGQIRSLGLGWERRWVTAIHADLQTPGSNTFLSTLDSMLRKPGQVRAELDVCFDVLAALRQELLRDVEDREQCRRIEDLVHAARFLTSSASEWLEVNRWLTSNETLQGALGAVDRLTQLAGQSTFWERLEQELRALSIHTCFVTRYVGGGLERSQLAWAYSSKETLSEQLRGQEFETSTLLPHRLASRQRDDAMIVRSLLGNGQPLGNVFISYNPANIATYDALVAVIASALERARRA
ncbi:MAG: hypothetical protein RL033_1310 [Pseudomonadota bacterium]|jgi:DNA-binding LacI/PurR family transcriptional regulator